ncbi:hypothetical protein AAG570_008206 [Ranatra chinensis]|uniref:Uncharacterized protein n=1 Tax=Ranatra chinensis TaxID=642074 RepID=A0ABD0YE91_9HEMI
MAIPSSPASCSRRACFGALTPSSAWLTNRFQLIAIKNAVTWYQLAQSNRRQTTNERKRVMEMLEERMLFKMKYGKWLQNVLEPKNAQRLLHGSEWLHVRQMWKGFLHPDVAGDEKGVHRERREIGKPWRTLDGTSAPLANGTSAGPRSPGLFESRSAALNTLERAGPVPCKARPWSNGSSVGTLARKCRRRLYMIFRLRASRMNPFDVPVHDPIRKSFRPLPHMQLFKTKQMPLNVLGFKTDCNHFP